MSQREAALAKADRLIALTCANPMTVGGVTPPRPSRDVIADALQRERKEGFSAGWKQGAHDKELEWKTGGHRRRRAEEASGD